MPMSDSQQQKLCLAKYELDCNVCKFVNSSTFKCDARIPTQGKPKGIIRIKHFFKTWKNDNIFHIIDQIKVYRIPLLIGHCHISMKGHEIKLTWYLKVRSSKLNLFSYLNHNITAKLFESQYNYRTI